MIANTAEPRPILVMKSEKFNTFHFRFSFIDHFFVILPNIHPYINTSAKLSLLRPDTDKNACSLTLCEIRGVVQQPSMVTPFKSARKCNLILHQRPVRLRSHIGG
jgi:hypothetical protein